MIAIKQRLLDQLPNHQHDWHDAKPDAQAAVLLLLCAEMDEGFTLLTRRSDSLPIHAGQISLPGGRRETGDASPEATALRETREELGLDVATIEILGRLPNTRVSSGIEITPVVGWLNQLPELIPNPAEVAEVIRLPMSLALDHSCYQHAEHHPKQSRPSLFIEYQQHHVWGATARILYALAQLHRDQHNP